jgi:hypothetical protein
MERSLPMLESVFSELKGAFEIWDAVWADDELDGTGLAGYPLNEAALFQADEHGIDRGWSEIEELLEIGVSGSHTGMVAHHVFADECKKLALLPGGCIGRWFGGFGRRGVGFQVFSFRLSCLQVCPCDDNCFVEFFLEQVFGQNLGPVGGDVDAVLLHVEEFDGFALFPGRG